MPVRVLQRNDGAQSGTEVQIVPPVAGWTDQQLLDWKVQTHQSDGWTMRTQGQRRIATKKYTAAERAVDPSLPAEVVREFRIA